MTNKSYYFLMNIVICLIVIINVLFASTPYSAIKYSHIRKQFIFNFMPEGWAFFTKNPRDPMVFLFRNEKKHWELANYQNSSALNLFGASRKARRMSLELANIETAISDSNWVKINADFGYKAVNPSSNKCISIKNKYKTPLLTGEYMIIRQEPVPFAWSPSVNQENMPYSYCYVKIY